MPLGINGHRDVGTTTSQVANVKGSSSPAGGSRPASLPQPAGLATRSSAASASISPRRQLPQAAARGEPAQPQPQPQARDAALSLLTMPQLQCGEAFGGGSTLQRVRNAFQQVNQFGQQLHQLAHQASRYPAHVLQQAVSAARPLGQGLHAGVQPPVSAPPSPQIRSAAGLLSAQAQTFDPAALNKRITQLGTQVLQSVLDSLHQSFPVPVALAQHVGGGGAAAAASRGGGPGRLTQE